MIKIFSDEEQLLRIHSDCKREDSVNLDSRSELPSQNPSQNFLRNNSELPDL
jgi:hypothetical protein